MQDNNMKNYSSFPPVVYKNIFHRASLHRVQAILSCSVLCVLSHKGDGAGIASERCLLKETYEKPQTIGWYLNLIYIWYGSGAMREMFWQPTLFFLRLLGVLWALAESEQLQEGGSFTEFDFCSTILWLEIL